MTSTTDTTRSDHQLFDEVGDRELENGPLGLLMGMNGARVAYLQQILEQEKGDELAGLKLLDLGCSIGLLSEPLAKLGCVVTGLDPSAQTLQRARERADAAGLKIDYREGYGESLPFAEASFEAVVCCDVLEHVDDLPQVLSEVARVLAPGGLFIYGTLNRTLFSWLLAIKVLQEWSYTRLVPRGLHHWQLFIRPRELHSLLSSRGLSVRDLSGLRPSLSLAGMLNNLHLYRHGIISACEFGRRLEMRPSRSTLVQYFGFAVKS